MMMRIQCVSLTQQTLVCEDVLRDPDAPVQVEDGVGGAGGDHQGVPRPLEHNLDDDCVMRISGKSSYLDLLPIPGSVLDLR